MILEYEFKYTCKSEINVSILGYGFAVLFNSPVPDVKEKSIYAKILLSVFILILTGEPPPVFPFNNFKFAPV